MGGDPEGGSRESLTAVSRRIKWWARLGSASEVGRDAGLRWKAELTGWRDAVEWSVFAASTVTKRQRFFNRSNR
jgi:hypothetical protein